MTPLTHESEFHKLSILNNLTQACQTMNPHGLPKGQAYAFRKGGGWHRSRKGNKGGGKGTWGAFDPTSPNVFLHCPLDHLPLEVRPMLTSIDAVGSNKPGTVYKCETGSPVWAMAPGADPADPAQRTPTAATIVLARLTGDKMWFSPEFGAVMVIPRGSGEHVRSKANLTRRLGETFWGWVQRPFGIRHDSATPSEALMAALQQMGIQEQAPDPPESWWKVECRGGNPW